MRRLFLILSAIAALLPVGNATAQESASRARVALALAAVGGVAKPVPAARVEDSRWHWDEEREVWWREMMPGEVVPAGMRVETRPAAPLPASTSDGRFAEPTPLPRARWFSGGGSACRS